MLTRKQMWRRVRPGGSRFAEPSPTPTPAPLPRRSISKDSLKDSLCGNRRTPAPINSLSIGDSILHLLGTSTAAPSSEDTSEEQHEAGVDDDDSDAVSPKAVSFKSQVRVVLVPCRRELHSLNEQLWWGADDYLDFRREYILAVKSAAAQAQQDNEQQQRPHPKGRTAAAEEAPEDDIDTPPCPPCPPSPLSSESLSTPLPPTNAEAAAAAAKVTIGTRSGQRQRHQQAACGADGVLLATSISPEALAAAAAAVAPPLSKDGVDDVGWEKAEEEEEEKEEGDASPLSRPPRTPAATTRSSCVRTTWTPFAGAAAAKAAAEESEESGYRTMSMSSVSDSNAFGGCTSSDSDADDNGDGYESDQEREGRALDASHKRLVACPREERDLLLQGRA